MRFEYDKLEDRGANTSGPSTRHNVTCTESTGSCRELARTFNVLLLDSRRCLTLKVNKQIDPYFFMASHGADAAPASPNAWEQRLGIALFIALFGLRLFPELPCAGTVRWPPMLWTGEG